jgi:SMI1 / KNR4 family (SUKH-1)
MDDIRTFFHAVGAAPNPGATAAELDAFEVRTGLSLPPQLRAFYGYTNGLTIDDGGLRYGSVRPAAWMKILPLTEVIPYVEGMRQYDIPQVWGYFPLTDCNDSNPYCVCCNGPLRNRVVHVFHDDVAELNFWNLGRFLDAVAAAVVSKGEDHPELDRLPGDYTSDREDRTEDEVRTGLELLRLADGLTDVELHDALRFAIDLLSEAEVDVVARLLETGDEYTAREAAARLRTMKSPRAADALRQYRRETARFVADCVAALGAAGLDVTEVRQDTACLKPGPVWLNLPVWFHRRREPGIYDAVVRRAKELLAANQQGASKLKR